MTMLKKAVKVKLTQELAINALGLFPWTYIDYSVEQGEDGDYFLVILSPELPTVYEGDEIPELAATVSLSFDNRIVANDDGGIRWEINKD